MAYFLKCNQNVVKYSKQEKNLIKLGEVKKIWFFIRKRITDDEFKIKNVENIFENTTINLENVCEVKKTSGLADTDENYNVILGTKRAGLIFYFEKNYSYWYYDTIEARDVQLAEIQSNGHLFKSKVIL